MLFEHFNLDEEGSFIRQAVYESLNANIRTPDIQTKGQPCYGTKEVGKWIMDYIG